jgi:hypothetical protein
LDASELDLSMDGAFHLNYQVRVVESARWVNEPIEGADIASSGQEETSFLIGYGVFNPLTLMACFIAVAAVANERENVKDEA